MTPQKMSRVEEQALAEARESYDPFKVDAVTWGFMAGLLASQAAAPAEQFEADLQERAKAYAKVPTRVTTRRIPFPAAPAEGREDCPHDPQQGSWEDQLCARCLCAEITRLRAAIAARGDHPVAVPREPTDAMQLAGRQVLLNRSAASWTLKEEAAATWRAMCDAAPQAVPADVERDAARYRFMRSTLKTSDQADWMFDAEVDKALASPPSDKEQRT